MAQDRLAGQVAIITGGASGIGEACAELFAGEGAAVVLAGRRSERGQEVADRLRREGHRATFVETDVTKAADCSALVQTSFEEFGRVDILVCCAAVMLLASVEESTEEQWDIVLDTNLKGTFLVSHFAIPHLRRSTRGRIIVVSSAHAIATQRRVAAYAASKAGLLGLVRQMAMDLAGDNILVNALVVGAVDTPMHYAHLAASGDTERSLGLSRDKRAIGRIAEASEIAAVALFLASGESSFITGASIVCDGGRLAQL
jgi:NAD(P)-dependent dehydrogenase (short-subunit alcohol dehydrogenase family)